MIPLQVPVFTWIYRRIQFRSYRRTKTLMGDAGLELCPYSPRNTQILNQVAQNAAHLLSHQGSAMAIWLN